MKSPLNILFLVFLTHFSVFYSLIGQSLFIEKIPLSNIITNTSVEDIFQDRDGFVWFATHTGLIQYSGSYTRVFSPKSRQGPRTKSEFFYKITEDKSNNLWIGSRNGLVFIDSTRNSVITYEKSDEFPLPNNRIFDLLLYNDSTLYLACDRSGLTTLNTRTLEVSHLKPIVDDNYPPLERIWVRQHWKGRDNKIYLRTSEGFFVYNPEENQMGRIRDDALDEFRLVSGIRVFGQHLDGTFWIIDNEFRLFSWDPGVRLKEYDLTDWIEFIKSGVFSIFPFDGENMTLPTNKGNLIFNTKTGTTERLNLRGNNYFDPPDARIVAMHRTREGPLFIGFRAGVTGMINPLYQDFNFFEIEKQQSDEILSTVFILDDEKYQRRFISTFLYPSIIVEDLKSGGFSEIPKLYPGNLSSNRMLIDSRGRLWICQNQGIVEVNRQTLETTYYKPDDFVINFFEIVEFREGEFFAGSFSEGLFYFVPDKGIFEKIKEENGWMRSQIFSMVYDDSKKKLWIGTVRNGLFQYDITQDTFLHFMPDNNNTHSIGGDWVRSIALGPDEKVWFAVDPIGIGSYCYNSPPDSAFQNFGLDKGLPSNFIAGIVFDHNGQMWMSSLAGIASFDPFTKEVEIFQADNGTRNQTFYYNNMSVNKKNEIFIGSNNGYFQFHPENLSKNEVPPLVKLIGMEIMEKESNQKVEFPKSGPLRLKYHENNIRFEFAVINFSRPEENEVFYKLNDQSEVWQRVEGVNQVYFSSLSPGNYQFRLRAKNYAGQWSENEIAIPFTISQPFYNTWWFYFGLLILLATITYLVYQNQLNQSLKADRLKSEKENLRSKMEKQMADLKLLSLRSQMNPHFIFNCLNSINRFILVNDNDTASEYLTKFARLIRKVLDNSRVDKITLDRELETLGLYIEMEKLRFVNKFNYTIKISPDLEINELLIQPMIIQPYVENAIWHGLMHKKVPGNLTIELSEENYYLKVIVTDDGIGREASKKIRSKLQFKHKSYGMKVTEERMEMEKYRASMKSNLNISDLYDEDKNPLGTKVEILLPIEKTYTHHEAS